MESAYTSSWREPWVKTRCYEYFQAWDLRIWIHLHWQPILVRSDFCFFPLLVVCCILFVTSGFFVFEMWPHLSTENMLKYFLDKLLLSTYQYLLTHWQRSQQRDKGMSVQKGYENGYIWETWCLLHKQLVGKDYSFLSHGHKNSIWSSVTSEIWDSMAQNSRCLQTFSVQGQIVF